VDREIVVYSTPLCAPCEALKSYLRAKGVRFVTRDLLVDEEAATLLEKRNIFTAPALGIDGEIYAGRDLERERLDVLLAI
jgi:glutaredoxin-like protein NrdH